MLDIAVTDSCPVNMEPGVDHPTRIRFASQLLDFLDRELETPSWDHIAHEYVVFARKAIEDGVEGVPTNLRADYLVSRALDCSSLTRTRALELATELFTMRNLLSEVGWFQGRVVDSNLAAELDAWLSIYSDLELGDAIAELLGDRMRRTRENP
ncbi:hypothetical protein [Streptomyces canus]|uniref:hypothetical protein n=1 Tax=Streptomyces canus TaxID=58343 RepID=UPI0036E2B44F